MSLSYDFIIRADNVAWWRGFVSPQTARSRSFVYLFIHLLVFIFSEARVQVRPFDGFWRLMAHNMRNHARIYLSELEYRYIYIIIVIYEPYYLQKRQMYGPK